MTEGGYLYSEFYRESAQRVHYWTMKYCHAGAHLLGAAQRLRERIGSRERKTDGSPAERELGALVEELEKLHTLLSAHEIRLVVLLINQQEVEGSFSDEEKRYNAVVKSHCDEAGISCFDPVPHFESVARNRPIYRMADDFHWSPDAHALVGRELGAFLMNEKPIF